MIGDALIAIFCTFVVGAGWYYLARSQIVAALEPYESPRRNRTRRKVRRMGAWGMILAAISGYWLTLELKWRTSPTRAGLALLLLSFALFLMLLSVFVDVYLTRRMTRDSRRAIDALKKRRDDEHP